MKLYTVTFRVLWAFRMYPAAARVRERYHRLHSAAA